MSHFIITGAINSGSPNRLEISDFVNDDKFFSLYVQALQYFSDKDQADMLSFFGVAGIHGLPNVIWDGSIGHPPPKPGDDQWEGYCTHGSVLFPTWHRPYVALYEQILQKYALKIAATYTVDPDDWLQAATNLRQPYWDWTVNAVPPDEVIKPTQVTITDKDGNQVQVDNPLYQYKFHPVDPSFYSPYSNWQTTLRHPTSDDADATDDIDALVSDLNSEHNQIVLKTRNLLAYVHTWPAFSNHTPGDGGSNSNSLEAIHDGVHVDVGGLVPAPGHMSDPSVAGFDPIFFLHHANVDRLLSLWSALNPGVWVTPGLAEDGGSFTYSKDATFNEITPLTPFWGAPQTYWASGQVKDTRCLGYSYPDFDGVDITNSDATKAAISKRVIELYYASAFTGATKTVPANQSRANSQQHPSVHPTVVAPPNLDIWDWTARVEFKKYEFGTSFSVLIFLGRVPENPREWRSSPTYVGGHHAFVNSAAGSCANCSNQRHLVVEGFVHLNHAISQLSGLGSLEPNVVGPYLTKNLQWRVLKAKEGAAELQSLEVVVVATPLSYPPGAIFPVPGQTRRYNRITHGRPGGSRRA